MRNITNINIKDFQYYTPNCKIDIKKFDPYLLSINKI